MIHSLLKNVAFLFVELSCGLDQYLWDSRIKDAFSDQRDKCVFLATHVASYAVKLEQSVLENGYELFYALCNEIADLLRCIDWSIAARLSHSHLWPSASIGLILRAICAYIVSLSLSQETFLDEYLVAWSLQYVIFALFGWHVDLCMFVWTMWNIHWALWCYQNLLGINF